MRMRTMPVVALGLVWVALTVGCGSETAQPDDKIVAPPDTTTAVNSPSAGGAMTSGPLMFKVQDPKNNNAPVPGVVIEFFATSGSVVVVSPAPTLNPRITDESRNCFNPPQCERFKVKTDNEGKAVVYFTIDAPPSAGLTADYVFTGELTAFTTASQATWKWSITVKK